MRLSRRIFGALTVVTMFGLTIGKSINTTPIRSSVDLLESIPRHEMVTTGAGWDEQEVSLPNHYPLETPHGRIEVAELWLHRHQHDEHSPYAYHLEAIDPPSAESHLQELQVESTEPSHRRQLASIYEAELLPAPVDGGPIGAAQPVNRANDTKDVVSERSEKETRPAQGRPRMVDVAAVLKSR